MNKKDKETKKVSNKKENKETKKVSSKKENKAPLEESEKIKSILKNIEDAEKVVIKEFVEENDELENSKEGEVTPLVELISSNNFDDLKLDNEIEEIGELNETIEAEIDDLNEKMSMNPNTSTVFELQESEFPEPDPEEVRLIRQQLLGVPAETEEVKSAVVEQAEVTVTKRNIVNVSNMQQAYNYSQKEIEQAINVLMSEHNYSFIQARAIIEEKIRNKETLITNLTAKPKTQTPQSQIQVIPSERGTVYIKNN